MTTTVSMEIFSNENLTSFFKFKGTRIRELIRRWRMFRQNLI